jgi:hypothetical protein
MIVREGSKHAPRADVDSKIALLWHDAWAIGTKGRSSDQHACKQKNGPFHKINIG